LATAAGLSKNSGIEGRHLFGGGENIIIDHKAGPHLSSSATHQMA
jgi:hypothetical protein